MKLSYDKDADSLSIIMKKGRIVEDKKISENVFAGFSKKGELLEVQFLDLSASEKPWLTVEAAAQILNKSERTILRWIKQGKLPSKKVGKEHHIDPQDLEEVASWQNIESAKPPRAYQITCGRLRFLFAMLGMSQRKLAYASQIILSLKLNMLRLHWCRRGDSATTVVRLTLTSCVASPQSLIKTSCFDFPC